MSAGNYAQDMLKALLCGELEPDGFNHRDHVVIAFAALEQYEFFEATYRVANGLRDLAKRAGVPEKFNATITLASISKIAERMNGGRYEDVDDFISNNHDLLSGSSLTAEYSKQRLGNPLARKIVLLPDLQ